MIPYKSRAGRAIRNFLGGTVGACAAFLLIVRTEAGEEAASQQPAAAPAKACEGRVQQAAHPCTANAEAAK